MTYWLLVGKHSHCHCFMMVVVWFRLFMSPLVNLVLMNIVLHQGVILRIVHGKGGLTTILIILTLQTVKSSGVLGIMLSLMRIGFFVQRDWYKYSFVWQFTSGYSHNSVQRVLKKAHSKRARLQSVKWNGDKKMFEVHFKFVECWVAVSVGKGTISRYCSYAQTNPLALHMHRR